MAYSSEEEYDGLRLGSRPGEYEGEDSFGAWASQDLEDDIEDTVHGNSELNQFEDNRSHRGHAVKSLNSLDGVGRFVLPHAHFDSVKGQPRISYCDHLDIAQDRKNDISFNPRQYKLFDWEIADFLQDDRRHQAIDNPKNQYYEAYAPLRQNIAVVRNAIYTHYFPDGEYNPSDPSDVAKRAKIHQMARKIGHELKWQSRMQWLYNMGTFNFSEKDFCIKRFGQYGQEHFGAQKIYQMLYNKQESLSWNPIHWLMGRANRHDWGLPHPEESPFCQQDMREAIYNDNRNEEMGIEDCGPTLCNTALDTEGIAAKLKTGITTENIQAMDYDQREESIELGREILRKLRDVCAGRSERMHEGKDHQQLDLERAHLVNGLAENYLQLYQDLLMRDSSIQHDSTFDRARIAIGKLGHLTMLNAMSNCSPEQQREFQAAYDQLPEEYKKVADDNEADLMRDVEAAMQEICNRQGIRHRAPSEVQNHAQAAVQNLHNTMSNPRIGAASVNIVDKAIQVSELNRDKENKMMSIIQDENDIQQATRQR